MERVHTECEALAVRACVLSRIRGGEWRPVTHRDADQMIELLRTTPRRADSETTLLRHAEGVLVRWFETVGIFLPRKVGVLGASRVVPDRVRFLGWLADVKAMIRLADSDACIGGSGTAVMNSINARYEMDRLRNVRAGEMEMAAGERELRNTRRRLACKIGLAWLACLPKMQKL